MYAGAQTFGFVLFIFCVGFQAGPQFFDVLMTSGLKYLSLALVVAVAIKVVGALLIVALLIIPAASARAADSPDRPSPRMATFAPDVTSVMRTSL